MAYGEFPGSAYTAYYKLSDLTDSSGHGHTLTNLNTTTFVPGKLGNCGNFSLASTQALYRNGDSIITIKNENTISCWASYKMVSAGYYQNIWFLKSTDAFVSYQLQLYQDTSLFYSCHMYYRDVPGSNHIAFAAGPLGINANTWFNIITTYDGSYIRVYVNGALLKTSALVNNPGSAGVSSNRIIIGGQDNAVSDDFPPSGYFWNGKIDELIITQKCWSQQEVSRYYTLTRGLFNPYIS